MTRHPVRLLVLAIASVLTAVALTAPADAAPTPTPTCGVSWGSLAKQAGNSAPGGPGTRLAAVRAGTHTCYDRLVLDINGATHVTSWRVGYVDAVRSDGSGAVVPLRGGAFLQIVVGAHNESFHPANARELANVADFPTFRQVASAGGSEGLSSVGLGVRARLPFRVLTVAGPGNAVRLVVDVAHRW
jgi:hypothetical protein